MKKNKVLKFSDIDEISITSTLDGSREKSLFHHPLNRRKAPLVVGLHTWSYDRFNQLELMLPYCRERGWALLLPEFRGPNLLSNPRARKACASRFARQDILDALDVVAVEYPIENEKVFLIGGSGGGHMALLTAAHSPLRWKGVSAWVPITDLAAWYRENADYAAHVAACCGGAPGFDAEVDTRYRERSPLEFAKELASVNLSLHHGRHDPVVHYSHSWKLALEMEKLGAGNFYFEIFDGGHDIQYERAFQRFDLLMGSDERMGKMLTG